jgi:hypothetical protein
VANDPRLQALLLEELGLAHEANKDATAAEDAYRLGIEQFTYYAPNHYQLCRLLKCKDEEAQQACERYKVMEPRGEYFAAAEKCTNK